MSVNHQIIVQTLVEQKHQELAPEKSLSDFFHIYSTEQILKNLVYIFIDNDIGQ